MESAEKLTFDEQTCLSEDQKHTSDVFEVIIKNSDWKILL